MTAPHVHVGDKVRITYTYEGQVEDTDLDWIFLPRSKHSRGPTYDDLQAVNVEVVERVAPKVGDVVKGADLDRLPGGSVVLDTEQGCVYQRVFDVWRCPHKSGGGMLIDSRDYRVLYVPEDGAE
jgi:hypothetical protein